MIERLSHHSGQKQRLSGHSGDVVITIFTLNHLFSRCSEFHNFFILFVMFVLKQNNLDDTFVELTVNLPDDGCFKY
jgi:hypothetical protein